MHYNQTLKIEVPFETIQSGHGHFHSNDMEIVVSDVGPTVNVWRWDGEGYGKPHAVCSHDGSFQIQQLHVHPRFNSDGT